MGRGDEQVPHDVFVTRAHADAALAAPSLRLVGIQLGPHIGEHPRQREGLFDGLGGKNLDSAVGSRAYAQLDPSAAAAASVAAVASTVVGW